MVLGAVIATSEKEKHQQSETGEKSVAYISQQYGVILSNREQRRFKLIYASSNRKRAFALGDVSVARTEDGISFSLIDDSQRDKVCGHLGTLATFVCFFENPDQSRPTIIHAKISAIKQQSGEFDVQLGQLGDTNKSSRAINLTAGWLLFRLAPGDHL